MSKSIFNQSDNHLKTTKWDFVVVLLAIITTGSSLVMITHFSSSIYYLISVASFGLLALAGIIIKRGSINRYSLLYSMMLSILILLSIFINSDFNIINFAIIGIMLVPIFVFITIKPQAFVNAYIRVMTWLALFSIVITYIIPHFVPQLMSLAPIRLNSGGFMVRDYIFGFHYVGLVSRNTGIFREMGVYTIFLNFALIFLLFLPNNTQKKYITFFILAMTGLSTLSTPGLVAMGIIIGAFGISHFNIGILDLLKASVLIALVAFLVFTKIPYATSYIGDSLNKLSQKSDSYTGRMDALSTNLNVWAESPIFGNGYTKATSQGVEYSKEKIFHNTSTTTSFMACYGIFYMLIITLPIGLFVWAIRCNMLSKISILLAILILINAQYLVLDSLYFILTQLMLLYSIDRIKEKGEQL